MAVHITIISSMATRKILADLARLHERQSGTTVTITSMGGVEVAKRVRAGSDADIVILASEVMLRLEAEGHIFAGSRKDFARSAMAIAVGAGTPSPAIHDETAVKDASLAARAICYSTGPSGDHLRRLWARWGLTAVMMQKAIQAPAGVPVGEMLARGEADLGFQQLSELIDLPGVDVVGVLPPAIQATTVFTVGIGGASSRIEDARALIAFLISPEADAMKRRAGMDAPQ